MLVRLYLLVHGMGKVTVIATSIETGCVFNRLGRAFRSPIQTLSRPI